MTGRVFRGVEVMGAAVDCEVAAAIAAEIGSPGVEVVEAEAVAAARRERAEAGVRYRIYFPDRSATSLDRRVAELWRELSGRDVARSTSFEEPERDWAAECRASFNGSEIGPFWIGPPWAEPPAGRRAIRIRPGRAFGTGLHPTTRVALQLLLPRVAPGSRVLDVGTGSGVLALAALAVGARWVLALDVDRHALSNARENAGLNAFAGRMSLVAGSLDALGPGCHTFDVIVANLEQPILEPLLPRLVSALACDGSVVVSGLLLDRRREFLVGACDIGLLPAEEVEREGWWGTTLGAG